MSIISESFCKKSSNIIELNLTSFSDCCVMVLKSNGDEKQLFSDHINYVFNECSNVLSNSGEVIIYVDIIENGNKIRYEINSIKDVEKLKEFKNNIKDLYKL